MDRIARALLACIVVTTATPVAAQQRVVCAERAEFLGKLSRQYSEVPVAMGIANNGASVVEILASQGGASWTIILTRPSGAACAVAAGENWKSLPALKHVGPPA